MAKTTKSEVADAGVYINPLTDFGFKRIFGTEANKDLLIDFLNDILKVKGGIVDLQFANTERKGNTKKDRTIFFDLHCTTGKGERIIVEVQNKPFKNYKQRVVFYASKAIWEQGKRGTWNYVLCPVYFINLINFSLKGGKQKNDKYISYIQLKDIETNDVHYDKLTLIYIELKRFNKKAEELQNNVEFWTYVFKNISKLENLPTATAFRSKNKVAEKLFEEARIANMTPEEYQQYEQSLKELNDMNAVLNERNETIAALRKKNAAMRKKNVEKDNALTQKDNIIAEYKRRFGDISGLN